MTTDTLKESIITDPLSGLRCKRTVYTCGDMQSVSYELLDFHGVLNEDGRMLIGSLILVQADERAQSRIPTRPH